MPDQTGINRRGFMKLGAGVAAAAQTTTLLKSTAHAAELPADITELGASRLSEAIHARQVSCVEVMKAFLERVTRLNPVYNAIINQVDEDTLLEQAARADSDLAAGRDRGWLHGIPHAVKDLANVKGLVTTFGSPLHADNVAAADDLHIARIRRQGAIFIGKTNTPEFGLGSQTYNTVFGATKNAWDPALTAGGSSGGAAVGLATHMLAVADGSDMMGSLRNPAAYNNVVGFRPSQGRVPSVPADIYYNQLSTNGPMGRNVEDTIRLLKTMSGYDLRAPLSLRDTLPAFEAFQKPHLLDFRIGWMGDYNGYLATEPGLLPLCEGTMEALDTFGIAVDTVVPEYDMARLWQTWLTLRHWSQSGRQPQYQDPAIRARLKPELVWEIEGSFNVTAADLYEAAVARSDWYRALMKLLRTYDVLALPAAQVFPFDVNTHWPDSIAGKPMDTYHRWMEVVIGGTLAGLPVVSLPAGFDARGRPMGIQFIGRMGDDQRVLEFAIAYEAITDFLSKRPPLPEPA